RAGMDRSPWPATEHGVPHTDRHERIQGATVRSTPRRAMQPTTARCRDPISSFRAPSGPVRRRLGPVAADRHAAPAPGVGLGAIEEYQRAGRTPARPDQPKILIADQVRRRFGDWL